ncbi:MAG TPA: VWA domain-containing protein [Pyrinomonadaceae bacterium]|nr:VWA domain-containing protein [Pyrinomonadaceae bacterium]
MKPGTILALLLLFSVSLPVAGQSQTKPADDKDDVVRITTNLVQIDAVVTKDGKPVPNLKAEDFEIYEDGKKQAITNFAYISNVSTAPNSTAAAPTDKSPAEVPTGPVQRDVARRTVAIVVDDLGLSAESMYQVRRQVRKFIAEELEPNDLVAIIRTGGEMGALQQFTNDRRLLNRAIDMLRWNACSRGGTTVLPRIEDLTSGSGCGGMTVLSTLKALRFILNSMGQLPGRKSMILMSDDIPIRAKEPGPEGAESVLVGADVRNYGDWLQSLTETAIRSSVVIYSVDTQGLQDTGPRASDSITNRTIVANGGGVGGVPERSAMLGSLSASRSRMLIDRSEGSLRIAQRTGGFQVRNSNGFQLDRIFEDQSGYYLIGYRPTEETFNRKFHNVKAKVKRSGMTLRTRYGFFGVTEEEANGGRPTIKDQTTLALLSPFGTQDIEVYQNSFFANPKADGSVIRSFVYLNPANLTFVPANGRRETPLEIHGVIFGDNGSVIEKVKHDIVLSLGDAEYEQAIRDGLPDAVRLRFDMTVKKPGSYQVRIAVRDRTSSKIGSAGQFVAVPNLNDKRVSLSGIVLRSADEVMASALLMANPPARRFQVNTDLRFAFTLYNAPINPATQLPNVTIQTKLFREGSSIGPPVEIPIDVKNQADPSRLFVNGTIRLDPGLAPGDYYLQIVVTDKPAKDKQPPITQWINFEVVK